MTKNEFLSIVLEFNILPQMALESDAVAHCIKSNNPDALRRVLSEEF